MPIVYSREYEHVLRTVIEHINRKLKIFKTLSLPYRNRRERFGSKANLIAGLVNAMG